MLYRATVICSAWMCALSLTACQSPIYKPANHTAAGAQAQSTPLAESEALGVVVDQKYCDDFLASFDKKPLGLEFVGCSAGFYEDAHSVIANYRVAGSHAFSVQEFLHRTSGMPRLIKDCCVWDSVDQSSGKAAGVIYDGAERYYVRMKSSELRLGWNIASDIENIESFDVQVIYPLNQYGFDSDRFSAQ